MRTALLVSLLVTRSAVAQLVDVRSVDPSIHVRLGYAGPDNFTHQVIYPSEARCFVQRSVASRLVRVQAALRPRHVGLELLDCYRPPSAQAQLWAVRPDPRYVADPRKGSRHARGAAVDVTLVDLAGQELSMPTAWDDATPRAHRDFTDLPADVLARRTLLSDAMNKEGFIGLRTEWWHFDASDWARDPPLDWDFAELVLPEAEQLVVVVAPSWDAQKGMLQRFSRGTPVGEPWPVALSHGLGWGLGVHAVSLSRLGGPTKHEGDRRSPAGAFALTEMTGYADTPPTGATLPYRQATADLYCIDDPNSAEYNQLARAPVALACASAEPMRRKDALYERTVFVANNPERVAGAGSCVFLHVGVGQNIGCTSMPLERLETLISWLRPGALLVQLPREVYDQLAPAWITPSRAAR